MKTTKVLKSLIIVLGLLTCTLIGAMWMTLVSHFLFFCIVALFAIITSLFVGVWYNYESFIDQYCISCSNDDDDDEIGDDDIRVIGANDDND